MKKYFEKTVCSQCKNKSENCMLIRKRKRNGCTYLRCANYQRKNNKKTGEYKIESFFLYRFLHNCKDEKNI